MASDADRCARLLSRPQTVPDLDMAWDRLQAGIEQPKPDGTDRRPTPVVVRRRPSFAGLSLRTGLVAGAIALVVAGGATAATLSTVFDPTHVASLPLSQSDLSALTNFMGLPPNIGPGQNQGPKVIGGFPGPDGAYTTSFGTIRWSSSGAARVVSTLGQAEAIAGFSVRLPSDLPNGVGAPRQFAVQPEVSATVTFARNLAGVGGSSVVLHAGPAILVAYGSSGGPNVPTMGILTMPRPTATSSGATISQIEAFLLAQPGVPPDLSQEVRLLGDVGTTLPVPVPAGVAERSVEVAGSPGVLVVAPAGVASGVVWEDGSGVLHAVAGLIDQHDALDVADQLG